MSANASAPPRALTANARKPRRLALPHPALARLAVVILLLVCWEAAARWFVDPIFMSPPSVVAASLGRLVSSPGVPGALAITFGELGIAFLLSVIIGLALGLAVGLNRFSYRTIYPIFLLLYAIPQVTILPLIILGFGIGPESKIVFGVTHGMFPVLVTTVANLRNIRPILLASARSMGAGRWHMFRYIFLPHMIPGFFTGLRLTMSAVLLGVLLAELYASSRGIGHFTRKFTESFDPTDLFGLVSIVACMAIVLNEILRFIETRFSRWQT